MCSLHVFHGVSTKIRVPSAMGTIRNVRLVFSENMSRKVAPGWFLSHFIDYSLTIAVLAESKDIYGFDRMQIELPYLPCRIGITFWVATHRTKAWNYEITSTSNGYEIDHVLWDSTSLSPIERARIRHS